MATHITNAVELQAIQTDLTADYILDNDIDLTGVSWTPIGLTWKAPFLGNFDGQGYTISNLNYDDTVPGLGVAGLFGNIKLVGNTISNLVLKDFTLVGTDKVGALFGNAVNNATPSIIDNVSVENVNITCSGVGAGGLGGYCAWGELNNCSATGSISSIGDATYDVGGLVGLMAGSATKCYADIEIVLEGDDNFNVGGLFGQLLLQGSSTETILDCYATGSISVTGTGAIAVGGFCGVCDIRNSKVVQNCYSDVIVSAPSGDQVGGFTGVTAAPLQSGNSIINCYSAGTVTGLTNVGGFIGYFFQDTKITLVNCSWLTSISTNAVGYVASTGLPVSALSAESWGTDEDTASDLYSTTHAVYDQGNANAWDFATPVWYEWYNDYPKFTVGPTPPTPDPESTAVYSQMGSCGKCGTNHVRLYQHNEWEICEANFCFTEEKEKDSAKHIIDENRLDNYRRLVAGTHGIPVSKY